MEKSVDQFEKAKEANQKWKYSNERISEIKVGGKLKLRLSGIKPAKDRVESFNWQRRCNDSTYSFWLACLFLSNPTCFSPTYQLESFLRICHKRKSSCHFAWRNGSIAVWMFVHPTEYGSNIGLERFSYQSKIISINIRISPLLSREKVRHAQISEITINAYYNSLSKVYRFIWSCRVFFCYWTCFSHPAVLVCFLAVVPFVIFRILLQQLQENESE